MANLIIKSSANDLVIQGSDESPAITVGATGTTTFAENATLSGTGNSIASLGTVASGNISNSAIVRPAGTVIAQSSVAMASNLALSDSTVMTTFMTATYAPDGGPNNTSTIYAYITVCAWVNVTNTSITGDYRKNWQYLVTGDDITNIDSGLRYYFRGGYNWENTSGGEANTTSTALKPVTLVGTGNADLTYTIKIANNYQHNDSSWTVVADGTNFGTHMQFWEVL